MGKHDYTNENSKGIHLRLYGSETKIYSDKLNIIKKACMCVGLSLSEFCRMAAIKEARKILWEYQKDKIVFAKKILSDEENRLKKEEENRLKKEELNSGGVII